MEAVTQRTGRWRRHDPTVFEQAVDPLPTVRGCRGCPGHWLHKLHADKGYDFARCHAHPRTLGITARIAQCGIKRNDRLALHRWAPERFAAGFFRRAAHPLRTPCRHSSYAARSGLLPHPPSQSRTVLSAVLTARRRWMHVCLNRSNRRDASPGNACPNLTG